VVDVSNQTKALCDRLDFEYHDYSNFNKLKEIDFFFSSHSLEHVHSLKDFMEKLSIILSKQSHVFIEVPYLVEENHLNVYSHAPHALYFNKKSLIKTFEKYGLKLLTPKSIIYIQEEAILRAVFYKDI
jgi:trans-aconitate methyltransferase